MAASETSPKRWTLYDLPVAAKLTVAAFLLSASLGYFSALVNLHFQEATPGKALPDEDDVVRAYSSRSKVSQFERLIEAHPSLPFNGSGSMRKVFTKEKRTPSPKELKDIAKRLKLDLDNEKDRRAAIKRYYDELDGERVALLAWVRLPEEQMKEAYENNALKRDEKLKKVVINPKRVDAEGHVQVQSIIGQRCTSCHDSNVGGPGAQFPLTDWDEIASYTKVEKQGKSLPKLALTTHVHLLGFSMLYGLTGLLLALTPLPAIIRLPLAPAALLAQVVDVSFWWLAQIDEPAADPLGPKFAKGIIITGGIVALSLGLQVLLTLFSMFGRMGKVLLVVAIAGTIGGGVGIGAKDKLDAYLKREAGGAMRSPEEIKEEDDKIKAEQEKRQKEEAYEAEMKKGNEALEANKFDVAIAHYNEALRLKPDDDEAKTQKAEAEKKKKDEEETKKKTLPPPNVEKDE